MAEKIPLELREWSPLGTVEARQKASLAVVQQEQTEVTGSSHRPLCWNSLHSAAAGGEAIP